MMYTTGNTSLTYIITSYTSQGNSIYLLVSYSLFICLEATSIQTSQWINQTSSVVTATPTTTRAQTTPNIVALYSPDTCQNFGYIKLLNGTCATKLDGQVCYRKTSILFLFY
jgi:hypothetical protein